MVWVGDVVLPYISVQPIAEIEEAIVHAEQDYRDHAGNGDRPVRVTLTGM
jgi:hypothetical protein